MDTKASQAVRSGVSAEFQTCAQRVDDRRRAQVSRAFHPVGDKAESDAMRGVGEAYLSARAIVPEARAGQVAPRFGVELEAHPPARIRRHGIEERRAFRLRLRRL